MPTMRDLYQSGRLSQYLLWLACGAGVVCCWRPARW